MVEQIKQCRSEKKINKCKGKGIVCIIFGTCLSWAQKEFKESLPPERIADVENAVLETENGVLKTSLSFEKENQEKLGTENRELKMLLASDER